MLVGLHAAAFGELAAEFLGECGALVLTSVEEQRVAIDGRSVREDDSLQMPVVIAFETRDRLLMHGDFETREAFAMRVRQFARTPSKQRDVRAPLTQHQREPAPLSP